MINDLSADDLLNIKNKIIDGIEQWSINQYPSEFRNHLGISEIGKPCSRQVFYKFRWMFLENFDGRMRRLFARGHREEEKFINYLEGIGCKVYRFDSQGKQFKVSGVMGHYGGSCDGVVLTPWYPGLPFLGEFKTHNNKSFNNYVTKGLKKAKPEHWDQSCGYGEKLKIKHAIYFPENKDDDNIIPEVVELDWNRANQLEKKASEIILAREPPPRISDNPAYYECKFCAASGLCHRGEMPLKNCRSCKNSRPTNDATWTCGLYDRIIPIEIIPKGCDQWQPI